MLKETYDARPVSQDTCVVHLVGSGDLDHNCLDHQVVDHHEADGTPTSEPCPGVLECEDCQDVLE